MPRFEKQGRSTEHFFELVLADRFVYTGQGVRPPGTDGWTIKDSDVRRSSFDDAGQARAFYEDKLRTLEADGFVLVGDATPEVDVLRRRDAAEQVPTAAKEAIADLNARCRAELEASQYKIQWVGKKPRNTGEVWELEIDANHQVITRRGPAGKRLKTEKKACQSREAAIDAAARMMVTATNMLGFGPK